MTISNPRYPHSIRITRNVSSTYDPFNDANSTNTEVEVYNGEGRNYKANNTNPSNGVLVSDYAVSIPFVEIEIRAGDKIRVIDRMRALPDAKILEGEVVDAYLGNMGLTVYWNKVTTKGTIRRRYNKGWQSSIACFMKGHMMLL
jgi:hypothetical protein